MSDDGNNVDLRPRGGRKYEEALAWSKARAAERRVGIRTTVPSEEAWEGSRVVSCLQCGARVDLCNPAIKKDYHCACGASLLAHLSGGGHEHD
jgi:hypothetical protein